MQIEIKAEKIWTNGALPPPHPRRSARYRCCCCPQTLRCRKSPATRRLRRLQSDDGGAGVQIATLSHSSLPIRQQADGCVREQKLLVGIKRSSVCAVTSRRTGTGAPQETERFSTGATCKRRRLEIPTFASFHCQIPPRGGGRRRKAASFCVSQTLHFQLTQRWWRKHF